jgi:REP element-mobilizing transposase RayT
MPQSLARIHYHLVFSTKNRAPLIDDFIRADLHGFIGLAQRNLGCFTELVNSMDDHVHILFRGSRTVTIAAIVEDLKTSSSKWFKTRGRKYADFYWQNGYGIFSVSENMIPAVSTYIANQQTHHIGCSFQEEYRDILRQNNQLFDERYLWD